MRKNGMGRYPSLENERSLVMDNPPPWECKKKKIEKGKHDVSQKIWWTDVNTCQKRLLSRWGWQFLSQPWTADPRLRLRYPTASPTSSYKILLSVTLLQPYFMYIALSFSTRWRQTSCSSKLKRSRAKQICLSTTATGEHLLKYKSANNSSRLVDMDGLGPDRSIYFLPSSPSLIVYIFLTRSFNQKKVASKETVLSVTREHSPETGSPLEQVEGTNDLRWLAIDSHELLLRL